MALDKKSEIMKQYDFYIIDCTTPGDVRSSMFHSVADFLNPLSCDYPMFDKWLDKVLEQTSTPLRSLVVCKSTTDGAVLGVSILKKNLSENKICTLRVSPDYRRQHIASVIMDMSLRILEDEKPLITVSEDHIKEFRPLLKKKGFKYINKVKSLYVEGKFEYFFNKPYTPEVALISIKPQFVDKILRGEKKVEFRRKPFSTSVKRAYIYSSYPVKRIVGYIDIDCIDTLAIDKLWNKYSECAGITKDYYNAYFTSCKQGSAIVIKQVHPLPYAFILKEVFGESAKPTQNYCYLKNVVQLQKLDNLCLTNK